ncbi:hypothetical protein QP028_04995 [Corynebacterium suedekumii]|nr:hypothetical protein QP028_04995 [Corynebacterium suedekumii]
MTSVSWPPNSSSPAAQIREPVHLVAEAGERAEHGLPGHGAAGGVLGQGVQVIPDRLDEVVRQQGLHLAGVRDRVPGWPRRARPPPSSGAGHPARWPGRPRRRD